MFFTRPYTPADRLVSACANAQCSHTPADGPFVTVITAPARRLPIVLFLCTECAEELRSVVESGRPPLVQDSAQLDLWANPGPSVADATASWDQDDDLDLPF